MVVESLPEKEQFRVDLRVWIEAGQVVMDLPSVYVVVQRGYRDAFLHEDSG